MAVINNKEADDVNENDLRMFQTISSWASFESFADHVVHNDNEPRKQASDTDLPPMAPTTVELVDLSHLGKGHGLVAAQDLQQGQVIFREQFPVGAAIVMPSRDATAMGSSAYYVCYCHNCFTSMEPLSSLLSVRDYDTLSNKWPPWLQLWPNPEFNTDFSAVLLETTGTNVHSIADDYNLAPLLHDQHDRWLCQSCHALFCSTGCKETFTSQVLSSCCLYCNVLEALMQVIQDHYATVQYMNGVVVSTCAADYWEILLATRIFCTHVTHIRSMTIQRATMSRLGQAMDTMCGRSRNNPCDMDELTLLQVGLPFLAKKEDDDNNHQKTIRYTVEPLYEEMCRILAITDQEKQQHPILSHHIYQQWVLQCRRNTLNVKTTSPLLQYEHNILRQQHHHNPSHNDDDDDFKAMIKEMAILIGKSVLSGCHASMDLNDYGTVDCGAILPLFARINHSCDPNVTVVGGIFDCISDNPSQPTNKGQRQQPWITLVATRDIAKGEELSVCYLSDHGAQLDQYGRNTRLQSRYLFTCQCSRCTLELTTLH